MQIKHSVRLISVAILTLVVVLVTSSVRLITDLTKLLNFITGPAWSTADGAMEGTIGLQQQVIALLMFNQQPEKRAEHLALLEAGTEMADGSMDRMVLHNCSTSHQWQSSNKLNKVLIKQNQVS